MRSHEIVSKAEAAYLLVALNDSALSGTIGEGDVRSVVEAEQDDRSVRACVRAARERENLQYTVR